MQACNTVRTNEGEDMTMQIALINRVNLPITAPTVDDELRRRWQVTAQAWLDNLRSDRTRQAYLDAWRLFLPFVGKEPWQVERADVIAWRDAMAAAVSAPTVCQRLAAVSSLYRAAQRDELVERNPCDGVTRPPVKAYGKAFALTSDELKRLLDRVPRSTLAGLRDRAILALAVTMALRRREIADIRRRHLVERGARLALVYRPKGKAEESRLIPYAAAQALREYLARRGELQPDDAVFVAHDNARGARASRPLSAEAIRALVHRHAQRALGRDDVHPHTLRHSAATHYHDTTGDRRGVQDLLGHARASTTDIYLHALAGDRRDVIGDAIAASLGLK